MPEIVAELPPAEQSPEAMPSMSFLDHLEELRKRLIYSILGVVVGFFFCWGYAEKIFGLMQRQHVLRSRELFWREGIDACHVRSLGAT